MVQKGDPCAGLGCQGRQKRGGVTLDTQRQVYHYVVLLSSSLQRRRLWAKTRQILKFPTAEEVVCGTKRAEYHNNNRKILLDKESVPSSISSALENEAVWAQEPTKKLSVEYVGCLSRRSGHTHTHRHTHDATRAGVLLADL